MTIKKYYQSKKGRPHRWSGTRAAINAMKFAGKIYGRWKHNSGIRKRNLARQHSAGRGLTKTKTVRSGALVDTSQHADLSHRYVKLYLSKKPIKGKYACTINHQTSALLTSNSGQQLATRLNAFLTPNQFVRAKSTGTPPIADILPYNFFDLNLYEYTTGSVASATNALPPMDRVGIKKITGEYQFRNFMTSDSAVEIWFVKKNTDANSSGDAITLWQAELGNTAFTGPVSVQATKTTNPTTGYPNYFTYGNIPTRCREWNKQHKILKVVKFDLQAGATKKIKFDIQVNRFFDKYTQAALDGSTVYYHKGQTIEAFIIARGVPVKDVTSGITYTSQITPSPQEIAYTLNYNVSLVYPPVSQRVYQLITDAGYVADPFAANSFNQINDVDAKAAVDAV